MTVISISIPESLLKQVDDTIKEKGFANRSEIFRQSLRHFISEGGNLNELEGEITATVTIIYERMAKRDRIIDVQHIYGEIVSTFLHAHIDENYCLEMIVVKGKAATLRKLVNALRSSEQIMQIKVAVLKETKL
jgi:CopG family nickel-responsive transcriptional regulator